MINERLLRETIILYAGYKIRACVIMFSICTEPKNSIQQQVIFISKYNKGTPFLEICLN